MKNTQQVGPISNVCTSYSEQLAKYIVSFDLDTVPGHVIDYTRLLLLDLLGAALAGVDTPEAVATLGAVRNMYGEQGNCALWGTDRTSTPNGAALYNGVISHARELDDFGGADHSGAVVIPALLAVVDAFPAIDGKRLLESIIVGYEVARRVLDSAGGYRPHNHSDGFHSTGTCGSFGAAAAVSKALALSTQQTVWALGIAGSFTGGTWAFAEDGTMSKRFNVGRAAETGLTACLLAQSGFTGPSRVLEAEWGGFLGTYAQTETRPEALVKDLGQIYRIMRSGIKPYAACRDIHSSLDVVLSVKKGYNLGASDISSVEIRVIPEMAQMIGRKDFPSTRFEAQLSLKYSVAVALVTGRAFLAEFDEPYLSTREIKNLAERITLIKDADLPFDSEPYLQIVTRNGDVIDGHVDFASGAPQNPLPQERVIEKYTSLASSVLPEDQCLELQRSILDVESLSDARKITQLLKLQS